MQKHHVETVFKITTSNIIPGNIDVNVGANCRIHGKKDYLSQQQPLQPFLNILHPQLGKVCQSHEVPGRHGHIQLGLP